MIYRKFTPQLVRSSLRAISRGRQPRIPASELAAYLLHTGSPNAVQTRERVTRDRKAGDFVTFAEQLFALEDPRETC